MPNPAWGYDDHGVYPTGFSENELEQRVGNS
jgi:hypothetical protein